jgi:hypothetical protein
VGERRVLNIYSIAAHRGFADALVAGIVPRYAQADLGLARLTLLLPSGRAVRTMSEAFIRHAGDTGTGGLLMPRMAVVGDLDLDETLGPLLDPLGADISIPPAVDPTRRWLRLAELIRENWRGEVCPVAPRCFAWRAKRPGRWTACWSRISIPINWLAPPYSTCWAICPGTGRTICGCSSRCRMAG